VSILYGVEFAVPHWQTQWPLTQGWHYHACMMARELTVMNSVQTFLLK